MSDLPSIQDRILALEERKVSIEEREESGKRQNRGTEILKANLAASLAFLTSIVSLFIAYRSMQLSEAAEQRRSGLEGKRLDLERRKTDAEAAQDDRKWHMELLDFSTKNRDLIFGSDEIAKQRIKNIMLVTFPAELVQPLFEKLEKVSPKTTAWKEGAQEAKALSPLGILTSRVWVMRIAYGQNADPSRPSTIDPDDVAFKFTASANGYVVWRMNRDQPQGVASKVNVAKASGGLLQLTFTREDLGNPDSRVNCKRFYFGRGATLHLAFDPTNAALDGSVDVARPDSGAPYKCADAQLLSFY